MPNSGKAKDFRDRAEELRTIAKNFLKDDAATRLIRLADDYEHMAAELEQKRLSSSESGTAKFR